VPNPAVGTIIVHFFRTFFLLFVLAWLRLLVSFLARLSDLPGLLSFARYEIFNCWPDTQTFFKSLKIALGIPSGKSIRL